MVTITAPSNDSVVTGVVPISVSMNSDVSWVNVYIDGVYLASTPPNSIVMGIDRQFQRHAYYFRESLQ